MQLNSVTENVKKITCFCVTENCVTENCVTENVKKDHMFLCYRKLYTRKCQKYHMFLCYIILYYRKCQKDHLFLCYRKLYYRKCPKDHLFLCYRKLYYRKCQKKFQDGFLRSLIKDFAGLGRGSKVEYRTIHQKEKEVYLSLYSIYLHVSSASQGWSLNAN